MAVGPVGSVVLVNQMTPAVTPLQGGQYTRYELQNLAAQALVQEKQQEVEEVRPTEENHAVDPDREHTRQEAEEELAQQNKKPKKDRKNVEDEEEDITQEHHLLDLRV